MADVITFPCEYLVIDSGYTDSLAEDDKADDLSNFCSKHGVIPLFVKDGGVNFTFVYQNDRIDYTAQATKESTDLTSSIIERLQRNKTIQRGMIVFRVGTFENASKVFTTISDLDYCNFGSMTEISFLKNNQDKIDLDYVAFDCESG
jgi:hypothetical protein